MLGEVLFRRGESTEAESLLLTAYEGLKNRREGWAVNQGGRCLAQLAELCETTARPEEAAKWQQKLAEFTAGAKQRE